MKKHHPYAAMFPMLTGDPLQEMSDDIKANGLRTPIVLDEQGQILDGRNRELACRMAEVEPRYVTFSGTEEEKLQFVLSQNQHRRHLTQSQRADIAARLVSIYAKQAKDRQRLNGKNRRKSKEKSPVNLPDSEIGDARDKAGKAMGVSGKSVDIAAKVHAKAIPEIIAAVTNGEIAVSAAVVVADLPQDEQSKILVSGGIPAVREAASVIRRSTNRGKSVVHEPTTPAPPAPETSCPPISTASSDKTPTDEPLTTLVERAKASSQFRRREAIEVLLATLPESEIAAVKAHCDELLQQRRNRQHPAKQDIG